MPPGPDRMETEYCPRHPLDLDRVVGFQQRGFSDPTHQRIAGVHWRAMRTPEGIATLALRSAAPGAVRAAAWGPGREWALAHVPALCGAEDDPSAFRSGGHPLIDEVMRRNPGLRLGRTGIVFTSLAISVFEQKVTGTQAFSAWRWIVTRFGARAPGPTPVPLFAPPSIDGWRLVPSWAWHRAGVEPPQARTVSSAARRGEAIERAVHATRGADVDRVLTSLPGVGQWTAAELRIRALGDPDAVSVGDYHLAHRVGYALTGRRTDDDGMLTLLSAWPGQRQRVIRLIGLSGVVEPRWAPRLHPEDHRAR